MLVDVSHLSEAGFWDVVELAEKPMIASHSNSQAVFFHTRNLTDAQFTAIMEYRGVVGLNAYAAFLGSEQVTSDDLLRHLEHFLALGGRENVALGGDWDGCDQLPGGIYWYLELGRFLQHPVAAQLSRVAGSRSFLQQSNEDGACSMYYVSTRDKSLQYTPAQAIAQGLSREGGLFLPVTTPKLPADALEKMVKMTYQQRAQYIMSMYLEDFTVEELGQYAEKAYGPDKFDVDDVAPLHKVNDDTYCLNCGTVPPVRLRIWRCKCCPTC